ncbi:MAG TPA: hypothetical protein VNM22_09515 [Candidatus Limnocylindrales bacterium]|nr:hypothetical protein [Candidatus Limnocylindrales bacterium]
MEFKPPHLINVGIKGERGLAFQEAYLFRPDKLSVEAILGLEKDFVPLKPGEETEVLVPLSDLPVNANVKKIGATLQVTEDTSPVRPEQTTVGVKKDEGQKETYRLEIDMPTRPRNVSLRLDQGEVFWTFAGGLVNDQYTLPDFAKQVNAYLDKIQPENGQVILRFLIKSDTPGKVKININRAGLDYSLLQTQTWKNPLDDTIRFDRNLPLSYGMSEKILLDPISDPMGHRIRKIEMDIGGEFGSERLLGNVENHDGKEFATVSGDYSVAQRFMLETSMQGVGVTGLFQMNAGAELYVAIQNDTNGFPSLEAPLAKSKQTLVPTGKNGDPEWIFTGFQAPVDLKAQTPYWIVIKGIQGKVRLALQTQTGYLQQILVNRGGRLWKPLRGLSDPACTALLRLVYLPGIDNQTAAIEIGIEGTQRWQRIDPKPGAQTISFDIETYNLQQVDLKVKSHARGTLSLANIIQEYHR